MDDESHNLPQHAGDPIPRPSSTSAAEAAVSQLLGMTGLTEGNGANESQQGQSPANESEVKQSEPPAQSQPQPTHSYHGGAPAATAGGNSNGIMTCQNCSTSITPLWRRDEFGAVLCNACGLFLKLHGRPRPISLKTDVIKSRNRVKTMRPDGSTKKKNVAPAQNHATRRQSNHANPDGTNDGPISRTGTPSMYNNSLPSFMMDDAYSTAVTGFGANGAGGDGSGSPMSGEAPQTHEQLIANNSSLRTRVRELELINELFRGRLSQLEQQEAAARRGHEVAGVEQNQLRSQLEDSHGRENSLKRRLDEMELELEESHRVEDRLKHRVEELEAQLKEAKEALEGDRPTKKPRLQSPEQSTAPQGEEAPEAPPQEAAAPEQKDDVGAQVA